MALRITILTAFLLVFISATGQQRCTELLSSAEEDYRNGRFNEISEKLCKCFGAYQKDDVDTGKVLPRRMRAIIDSMKIADVKYAAQLGSFRGYWKRFIMREEHYTDSLKLFFTYEERYKALVLLGKIYEYLGVLPLAEFLAARAIIMYPEKELKDETLSFNKLFESQRKRVGEISLGPLIGWSYALADARTNYRPGRSDFQYQSDGRVVLGVHFNYLIRPSLTLNMNFWFHGTRIVYLTEGPSRNGDSHFDFYHAEKQGWIKFPLLIKWSPANHFYWLRKQELWKAKIFIAAGISANFLTASNATIIDLSSNTSLYAYDVTSTRNKFNSDFVVQILTRFQLGRNYLNIGFTGTYGLKNILKEEMIGNPDNKLYGTYGIVENNYKLAGGFWTVTYELRFNYLKK